MSYWNILWIESRDKMDYKYKSLLPWYSFIMLMAFNIGLQANVSFVIWFLNHAIVIIAFYIERDRLRKYFKQVHFNMYQYNINEMNTYYWKLRKLVKSNDLSSELEGNIKIYLSSSKLLYLLGVLNFISIFVITHLNKI